MRTFIKIYSILTVCIPVPGGAQATSQPTSNVPPIVLTEIALSDTKVSEALAKLIEKLTTNTTQIPSIVSTSRSELVIVDPKVSDSLTNWLNQLATAKPQKETSWDKE